jgi:hypothetical protein
MADDAGPIATGIYKERKEKKRETISSLIHGKEYSVFAAGSCGGV